MKPAEPDFADFGSNAGSVSAVSTEIAVHRLILQLVLLPLTLVALPVFAWVLIANFWVGGATELLKATPAEPQWWFLALGDLSTGILGGLGATATFAVAAVKARRIFSDHQGTPDTASRYQPVTGAEGRLLQNLIGQVWGLLHASSGDQPSVVWFANLGIIARALPTYGMPRIAVSAGLWSRAIQNDLLARFILLHEMAHLAHGDLRVFARLKAVATAAIVILRSLFWASIATIVWLIAVQSVVTLSAKGTLGTVLGQAAVITAQGAILIGLIPLMGTILRRYISFVVALTELRADVCAGVAGGGLERFATSFARDATVHQSTPQELRRSLFSSELTHLPESERHALLSTPERLFTPKLRYFWISLAGVLLLPLTGYIGYVLGGILAWLAVVAVAAALTTSTILMVGLCGAAHIRLSWATMATLGVAIVLFTAASQIRLDAVNYLLASEMCGLAFSGCGNEPSSLKQIASDTAVTLGDLGGQLANLFADGWLLASMSIAILALRGVWIIARKARLDEPHRQRVFVTGVAVIVCLSIFVDSYNEWRGVDDILGPASDIPQQWTRLNGQHPVLRFSLAPLSAVIFSGLLFLTDALPVRRTFRSDKR
jgi:Zn-dependent protease with chaperone function